MTRQILSGARIFDGTRLREGLALVLDQGRIAALLPEAEVGAGARRIDGIIAPGFVDLQVNGGGGVMVDGASDLTALRRICATHRRMGSAGILPTLITDQPEAVARVIGAGIEAARAAVPGFLGLHLEGPHLDPRRKGAHDPALIRPMTAGDLTLYLGAAAALPALMITLAPEAASLDQVARLAAAGVVVSLGHSDCDEPTARAYMAAGAGCATHLFNAMSQIGNRAPGLAGAVLTGQGAAGLIADGIHVHPATMRIALAARGEGIFLVTDCMAFAGTALTAMPLHGRMVQRRDGRLTLADGTLAGADLTLPRAVANLVTLAGATPERALAMASAIPAAVIGAAGQMGSLLPGRAADLVHLADDLSLRGVCMGGVWEDPPAP